METTATLEAYFQQFRDGIIGQQHRIPVAGGRTLPLLYADWIASGRSYGPIEDRIQQDLLPLVANTHTDTNSTGSAMTHAYWVAQQKIKQHVHAGPEDVIITAGSGMTRVVNKFQRLLGMKENVRKRRLLPPALRPVVFVSHMEHHSNHTSWLETSATVEIIRPAPSGRVDFYHLRDLLQKYRDCPQKIASVTACSNVTGIQTDYKEIAQIMHEAGGYCFVDFACSAPYVDIDMHPDEEGAHLDAIFFSPHKFLGGPGSTGVLVFNRNLYQLDCPDQPGGGTVVWTGPFGPHQYFEDIETREDGGTPAFLQTIRAAMAMSLKEKMGTAMIHARERELLHRLWDQLEAIPNLHILAPDRKDRLGVISFYLDGLHHSLGVRMLNDQFGIQVRGGCSCAGTYGHYLFDLDEEESATIGEQVLQGDHSLKPGWIRVSLHPTMTDEEVDFIGESIRVLAQRFHEWLPDYQFDPSCMDLTSPHEELDADLKRRVEDAIHFPCS